jgi:hypothetical protein
MFFSYISFNNVKKPAHLAVLFDLLVFQYELVSSEKIDKCHVLVRCISDFLSGGLGAASGALKSLTEA